MVVVSWSPVRAPLAERRIRRGDGTGAWTGEAWAQPLELRGAAPDAGL